jgi:hypothetical protein
MRFDLDRILRRPLIVGASVSADWSSLSPGKRAALRHTRPELIRTIATGGATSREVWQKVDRTDLVDRSVIIAVDLFFWDSTFTIGNLKPSLTVMKAVANTARDLGIPLVLGEIPALIPERQPSRDRLNDEIAKIESHDRLCRVMPFDRIHREILSSGSLSWRGKTWSITDLVPDGLHLSEVASEYLAEEFEALFHPRASEIGRDKRASLTSPPRV